MWEEKPFIFQVRERFKKIICIGKTNKTITLLQNVLFSIVIFSLLCQQRNLNKEKKYINDKSGSENSFERPNQTMYFKAYNLLSLISYHEIYYANLNFIIANF